MPGTLFCISLAATRGSEDFVISTLPPKTREMIQDTNPLAVFPKRTHVACLAGLPGSRSPLCRKTGRLEPGNSWKT